MSEKVLNEQRVSEMWTRVKAYAAEQGRMSGIPAGGIIIWSGAAGSIPAGWALCDGTGGTPDLRSRFVLGAGGSYPAGTTGGEAVHTLTEAEMPAHVHEAMCIGHSGIQPEKSSGNPTEYPAASFSWRSITTDSAGGGGAHNNMPPYYALAYIMKL